MNSSSRWLWIIIGVVVILGMGGCCCLGSAVFFFLPRSAASWNIGIGPRMEVSDTLPLEQYQVDTPHQLVVENPIGDVDIQVGTDSTLSVQATKRARGFSRGKANDALQSTTVDISSSEMETRITVDMPDNIGAIFISVDLTITIPQGTSITIDHGVGAVDVRGAEGQVNVELGVGDVNLRDVRLVGDSVIDSGTGSVRFAGELPEVGALNITLGVGDIRVSLPSTSEFRLEADTGVGDIDSEFDLSGRKDDDDNFVGDSPYGTAGDNPNALLILHTGTGDIDIRQR